MDPLRDPLSVNDDDEEETLLGKPTSRQVVAPAGPFGILVGVFLGIMAILVTLSLTVGGCDTNPTQCALDATATAQNVTLSSAVRALASPPAFLRAQQKFSILGSARMWAFAGAKGAYWVRGDQVEGQYSRIGSSCGCARANRTTLGSVLLSVANFSDPNAAFTAFQNGSTSIAGLIDVRNVTKALQLPATSALRARPTAAVMDGNTTYLFVDVVTTDKDDPVPRINVTGVAVGDLSSNKLFTLMGVKNDTSLRPTAAVIDTKGMAYLYLNNGTLARIAVKELTAKAPLVEYFSKTNATHHVWVAKASAATNLGFGCQVVSLIQHKDAKRALCITPPSTKGSSTTNELHMLEMLGNSDADSTVSLMTSAVNAPFVSATWHPETATYEGAMFTTMVSVISKESNGAMTSVFFDVNGTLSQ